MSYLGRVAVTCAGPGCGRVVPALYGRPTWCGRCTGPAPVPATRADLARAYLGGRRAGREGLSVLSCPWRPRTAGALTLAYVRGHVRGLDERAERELADP